jgi:hypothetical protein
MGEILDVKGVGEGNGVNAGCVAGGTVVGVLVFSTTVAVAAMVAVGTGVAGEAHAARRMETRMIIFFMMLSLPSLRGEHFLDEAISAYGKWIASSLLCNSSQ